jgi:sugar phosphate permease
LCAILTPAWQRERSLALTAALRPARAMRPDLCEREPAALTVLTGPQPAGSRIVNGVSRHFYYGWVIVGMGFIAQMLTSVAMQGLSTYVAPLQHEFGWSLGETAAGRSFQQVDAFLGPINGWLVDRFGARRLMSCGVILYFVAFVLFSRTESLWGFYGSCLLMAVANSLAGLLVVSFSVNHWFRRRRSTALGLAVMGLAAAGMLFLPVIVWAQTNYGWRTAALGSAVGMLLAGIPIMLFMRDAPERYGLLPDGDRPGEEQSGSTKGGRGGGLVNFSLRQALRTRAFWLIAAGTTLANAVQAALIVHQFPHLEHLLDRETAAVVLSEVNAFSLAGRFLGGMLGDRFPKRAVMGVNLIGTTLGILLLAVGTTFPVLAVYGALFGFSWGTRTAVMNSLQGDYFGRLAFGKIVGLTATLAAPLVIASPVLVGVAVDALGEYEGAFLLLAVAAAIASLLFFAAARPDDPA